MKINVLGTDYEVITKGDAKGNDGYTDFTSKKIVIQEMTKATKYEWDNLSVHEKRTIRHELVHAFMHESGLCHNSEWGRDETLVDWIAIQAPKLIKAFKDAKAL